jgi:cytochrome b subunit of formate dehydrogenase
LLAALCIAVLGGEADVRAASEFTSDSPPEACDDCHDGAVDDEIQGPPHALLAESVHSDEDCDSCHADISLEDLDLEAENPHPDEAEPVACGDCHDEEAEKYRKHGRLEIGVDPDLPSCWDCHGSHEILPSSDRHARTHPVNLPNTCRACHANVDLVEKHETLREQQVELYQSSVHSQHTEKGVRNAATCYDCHGAVDEDGEKDSHRILGPNDPESSINHFNIPKTCAQCHEAAAVDYSEGIHGQLAARGDTESPVCTHCHGEHGIISPSDPRSPVSAGRVAEATCTPCHESEILNEKYGIISGSLPSYIDTYHGLKRKSGDVRVANCASCHGAHRILPHTEATSSIHPDNLETTCGECHPGISGELAATRIHADPDEAGSGWPYFFKVLYLYLIAGTVGGMLLHNAADWLRQVWDLRKRPFVIRLSASETAQHWLLATSFIVLVITGFSLRFGDAWWVQILFGWGDGEGFVVRGTIHRASGVAFMVCSTWHLIFLTGRRGRRLLRDLLPDLRDLREAMDNVLYFLGRREHGPRFRRFGYAEKVEYWALVWGGIVMTLTGILLWFDNYFVGTWGLPKVVLDVMLVIHYYEAWLATLAIIIWHGYGVIFNPRVYPMNPAWVSGKMPEEMYRHEHPDAPRLKARRFPAGGRRHPEEELEAAAEGAGEGDSGAVEETAEPSDDGDP